MSQQAVESVEPVVNQTETTPVVEDSKSPYADILAKLPESVVPLVEPTFKEWDAQTTQKFQELHSQYEPYKNAVGDRDLETVSQAFQLVELLESDPKALYDYMGTYYGYVGEQGQAGTQQVNPSVVDPNAGQELDPNDLFTDPRLLEMKTMVDNMAQIIVANQQQMTEQQQLQQYQEQQSALDKALEPVKETLGAAYDEGEILSRLTKGLTVEQAVEDYKTSLTTRAQAMGLIQGTSAPVVMSANGGSSPSVLDGGKRPGDLTDKETTDVVVQMLQSAANS